MHLSIDFWTILLGFGIQVGAKLEASWPLKSMENRSKKAWAFPHRFRDVPRLLEGLLGASWPSLGRVARPVWLDPGGPKGGPNGGPPPSPRPPTLTTSRRQLGRGYERGRVATSKTSFWIARSRTRSTRRMQDQTRESPHAERVGGFHFSSSYFILFSLIPTYVHLISFYYILSHLNIS